MNLAAINQLLREHSPESVRALIVKELYDYELSTFSEFPSVGLVFYRQRSTTPKTYVAHLLFATLQDLYWRPLDFNKALDASKELLSKYTINQISIVILGIVYRQVDTFHLARGFSGFISTLETSGTRYLQRFNSEHINLRKAELYTAAENQRDQYSVSKDKEPLSSPSYVVWKERHDRTRNHN